MATHPNVIVSRDKAPFADVVALSDTLLSADAAAKELRKLGFRGDLAPLPDLPHVVEPPANLHELLVMHCLVLRTACRLRPAAAGVQDTDGCVEASSVPLAGIRALVPF